MIYATHMNEYNLMNDSFFIRCWLLFVLQYYTVCRFLDKLRRIQNDVLTLLYAQS